jgi:hypothetical protein
LILLPCSVDTLGCAPCSVQRNLAGKDFLHSLVDTHLGGV